MITELQEPPVIFDFLVQADVRNDGFDGRFWLAAQAGRDQIAMQVLRQGWLAYEAPLPQVIASWCRRLQPVFLDIGANSGFFSLLAAVCGAAHVHAFEPVPALITALAGNIRISELDTAITLHPLALGARSGHAKLYLPLAGHALIETSASLNATFSAVHSQIIDTPVATLDSLDLNPTVSGQPLLIKIDVESEEAAVLAGAKTYIHLERPAIVCELLPSTDLAPFHDFLRDSEYCHYAFTSTSIFPADTIIASMADKNHLFLPKESRQIWLPTLES